MGRRVTAVGVRLFAWVVASSAWAAASPASASDFWEEVRSPGVRTFRTQVARGRAALEDRRWPEALAAGERARTVRPTRCEGPWIMGRAHAETGQMEAAVDRFREALAREGGCLRSPADGALAAKVAAMAGEVELAAEVLGRVLATMADGPRRRALFTLRGDVLLTLGPPRLQEAIRAYREVLRRRPDGRAQLGLALALRRAGKPDQAAELARRAAAEGRVDALVGRLPVPEAEKAARRAMALEALGDVAGARQAWRAATDGATWSRHAQTQVQRLDAGPRRRP